MDTLITQINKIICDYQSNEGFVMNNQHIQDWVNQFDFEDREFILKELLYLLNKGIYISKENAKKLLNDLLISITRSLKYNTVFDFLKETSFIKCQIDNKSQDVLLKMLDNLIQDKYSIKLSECGVLIKKNIVYLDDILGTGGTILNDIKKYVENENILDDIDTNKIKLIVLVFCQHEWASARVRTSLKYKFNNDVFNNSNKFKIFSHYLIEDNIFKYESKLNLAIPLKLDPKWDQYLHNIEGAVEYENRAFRKENQPFYEELFSSIENRNRFEQIILDKGIQIIDSIKDESKKKLHRPLGKTYSRYKTFGTGTLFFTWRNISNTCPIVFWWNNTSHNWKGLFPLVNRGIKL